MQLILVNDGHRPKCEEYLIRAAAERKIKAEVVGSKTNFFEIGKQKDLSKTLIYRVSANHNEALIERDYLAGGAISFFEGKDYSQRVTNKLMRYQNLAQAQIPIPKTIFSYAPDAKNLKQVVKKLDLPIILKTLNGFQGTGVMIVDSYFGLKSAMELLIAKNIDFLLQEFIPETVGRHIRAVAIGNEIICAYEKQIVGKSDFRSNSSPLAKRKIVKLDSAAQAIVLGAIRAIESSFGGVDLLYAKKGYMVTEVNFPCNFAASQDFTGIDIAGKMLDYLVAKAKREQ